MSTREKITKEEVMELLGSLNEPERKLLSRILVIEQENLHLQRPRVTGDIVKAIKEIVK